MRNYAKTADKGSIIRKMLKIAGLLILVLLVVFGIRLYQLSMQREQYKQYWQERAAAPVPENALVYVALGDSTAQGIGASKPENGYVGLLAKRLEEKTGRPVHVVNLSVTGARVADVVDKQIPQLQQMQLPDDAVVTLGIGSNNVLSFDAEEFRSQFAQLAPLLPKQTVVADVPYFGGRHMGSSDKKAQAAGAIIREIATAHGLEVAALHDITKSKNSWLNYAADFFHPNDRAYKLWADAFWAVLKERQL
jgi:acyl-CoA thioesterase-1